MVGQVVGVSGLSLAILSSTSTNLYRTVRPVSVASVGKILKSLSKVSVNHPSKVSLTTVKIRSGGYGYTHAHLVTVVIGRQKTTTGSFVAYIRCILTPPFVWTEILRHYLSF
ncbi:hypothetical protein K501DRAFT_280487 [Backusella circina FSU 941]|nr:hypothetical protein K501DRAFT_280487 [Backusella circina FSU 941]